PAARAACGPLQPLRRPRRPRLDAAARLPLPSGRDAVGAEMSLLRPRAHRLRGQGVARARHSLRLRFVFAIAALVALVLLANSLVLALANRPRLREDLENRARAYGRLSAAQVCNAYETYYASGYSKFREIVEDEMRLEPDLLGLAIYDTGGRALFD